MGMFQPVGAASDRVMAALVSGLELEFGSRAAEGLAQRFLAAVADLATGIVVVEQNARQALAIADRACVIRTGEIIRHGTSREVHAFLFEGECMDTLLQDSPLEGVLS